mmetsp:Transcript_11406/g.26352  ORF Transcript_11406/g.26352 Transcript_11406/m.26352 type:complete len:123 (-) Transcript_11406:13-381(-)
MFESFSDKHSLLKALYERRFDVQSDETCLFSMLAMHLTTTNAQYERAMQRWMGSVPTEARDVSNVDASVCRAKPKAKRARFRLCSTTFTGQRKFHAPNFGKRGRRCAKGFAPTKLRISQLTT